MELIKLAIREDWSVAELQPIIFVKSKEEERFKKKDDGYKAEIGHSERLVSLLMDAGITTFKELMDFTPTELLKYCKQFTTYGLGPVSLRDIIKALEDFDRHKEAAAIFVDIMMPNPLPTRKL